jgi:hypothetical protein
MAVRKANKKSMSPRRAATKKSNAKRPAAKSALKRTRRASVASKGAVKTPRASAHKQLEPERKPIKKAEVRPVRPPAVLPIPQSTFFF